MTAQTRLHDAGFFLSILNAVDQEIAVIDREGAILFVNDAWVRFGLQNGAPATEWLGTNYLSACIRAERFAEAGVHEIMEGFRSVLGGAQRHFEHEYPCHSPDERRWFMMALSPLGGFPAPLFVVTHTNITERKRVEENVEALSLRDDLTGLANRRHFERVFEAEWRRARRERTPLSLVIFDLDHFKALNDRFGHLVGDRCIRNTAALIGGFAQRASDLAARWGGEEFILVMGNMPLERAVDVAEAIRVRAQELHDPAYGLCTVSAGVAAVVPRDDDRAALLRTADAALYQAKQAGRNRVVVHAGQAG